jgi:WhiB family transcriptional regulator, redox-sensing transcriptional regulator
MSERAWVKQAACLGTTTPDLWFPKSRHRVGAEVRAICQGCPVRFECLDYAVRWNIRHGVWGGLSSFERRRLHSRAACARRAS